MTRTDIVNKIVEAGMTSAAISKKDTDIIVKQVFDAMKEAMIAGDKIVIADFGTFDIKERAARKGRNPQTGEEIEIAASKNVHFKAGKALKDAVNA